MDWLTQFIDYKRISVLNFEKKIGVRSTIQKAIKNNSNVGSNLLAKIVVEFPEINPEWLLTGKGEMLRNIDGKREYSTDVIADKIKIIEYQDKEIEQLKNELAECEAEKKLIEDNKSNV